MPSMQLGGILVFTALILSFASGVTGAPAVAEATSSTSTSKDGHALYLRHCAVCHGDKGYGGVGVPLALPDFQASVPDDYLKKSIRYGRPGRVMPAFSRLSDAENDAIVAHIRSWTGAKPLKADFTPINGDSAAGEKLFEKHCASCHGDRGQGGEGTGVTFSRPRDLPIIAPALNNSGFLASASDRMIKHTLKNGRRDTPMKSFSDAGFSDKDLDDVVSFVRSFEKKPTRQTGAEDPTPPILVAETEGDMQTVLKSVKDAITGANFRLIRVQSFDDGLVEKNKESKKSTIVYFCNFEFLYKALGLDPRIGLFLPCRVTVVQEGNTVKVMAINPAKLSHLFNNAELDRACEEMTRIYETILEESTL